MASLRRSSLTKTGIYGLIVVLVLLSSDDTNLVRLHTSSKEKKRTFFGVNLFLCQNLFRVREGLLKQLVWKYWHCQKGGAYLIFVPFGTPPYFLACKKYAKKGRKFVTKIASRQNSVNFWLAYLVFWLAYLVFWLSYLVFCWHTCFFSWHY